MSVSATEASEYHSKDFDWETLRQEIESDPSLTYHLLPFISPQPQQQERRYLLKEFPELVSSGVGSKVLEIGCGNGSTALPILRGNDKIILYACDCSNETLQRAKEIVVASNVASVEHRFRPFYCDFATTGFPKWLACDYCRENFGQKDPSFISDVREERTIETDSLSMEERSYCIGGVDFITLIFTLSAVPLHIMPTALRECFSVLKPGGMLLFRDYGLYDMTMLRFEHDQRVGFREYMRSEGTRSYFFCLDTVRNLFICAGFIELEIEYCCVKSVNRRNGKSMKRVWVHGKFQKPA
ncbi:Methyltransferase family protein isoform 4 [Hibiscus syriacus]|uniref:tRNA N(3)-methylcytidine methyltransferase n=1 Tax=Hibiscus syriacus TaxID=106335 RepID=A0A6A3CDN3_HIBSY|nr:Methyltransferase family protein isoform 4 [Hibiscus syriacus]